VKAKMIEREERGETGESYLFLRSFLRTVHTGTFFLTVCFYFINFYSCTRYKLLCSYNSSSSSVTVYSTFFVLGSFKFVVFGFSFRYFHLQDTSNGYGNEEQDVDT